MADLDDFFAKKDRKKSKTTKKFSTTDEVAKKLEDTAKKTEKLKKERVPEGEESNAPTHVSNPKIFRSVAIRARFFCERETKTNLG